MNQNDWAVGSVADLWRLLLQEVASSVQGVRMDRVGVLASTHRQPRPPCLRPMLRKVVSPCVQAVVALGGHRSRKRTVSRLDACRQDPFYSPETDEM